jgi:DNA-binding MarR family transcriptional regulator
MGEASQGGDHGQRLGERAPAFLLAQVGAHAAARFAARLEPLDLTPAHAGAIRVLALSPGISQRELSDRLGLSPSRLVGLLDQLERRGLVERRSDADDRRNHALHLTPAGTDTLRAIGRIAVEHQDEMCRSLGGEERATLARLLDRIASDHGLTPGVHPGYRQM